MKFITRKEWKAKTPMQKFIPHVPVRITVHHVGADDPTAKVMKGFKGEESIRNIQKYHITKRAFIDIAYHRIVAPNGDIYEGRPYDVSGAHVSKQNTGNIGICLYGNFETDTPTPEQIESLKFILKEIMNLYNIKINHIYCHRELMARNYTECPGKNLIPIILDIKFGKIKL